MASMSADVRDAYLAGLARSWPASGWPVAGSMFHVWDEPSAAREQNEIPALNTAIHAALPGAVTYATTFPVVPRPARRLCKWFGDRACRTFPGVTYSEPEPVGRRRGRPRRLGARHAPLLRPLHDAARGALRLRQQPRALRPAAGAAGARQADLVVPLLQLRPPAARPRHRRAADRPVGADGVQRVRGQRGLVPLGRSALDARPAAVAQPVRGPAVVDHRHARSNGEASLVYPGLAALRADRRRRGAGLVAAHGADRRRRRAREPRHPGAGRARRRVRAAFRPVFSGALRVTDTGASWLPTTTRGWRGGWRRCGGRCSGRSSAGGG